jgi:hypothetical protein
MRSPSRVAALAVLSTVVLAPAVPAEADHRPPASAGPAPVTPRQEDYAAAARAHGVPESVLLGVSYLMSRWDQNNGLPSTSGGYGPMHLVDTARAARLTGLSPAALRADPAANIQGGAALLADHQRSLGEPPEPDPHRWYGAVLRYAREQGGGDPVSFADEVFATIREGAARTTDDGHLVRLPGTPQAETPQTATSLTETASTETAVPTLPPGTGTGTGTGQRTSPPGKRATDVQTQRKQVTNQQATNNRLATKEAVGEQAVNERAAGSARGRAECPRSLSCVWIPAAHQRLSGGGYGNHDRTRGGREIDYIVIHDGETTYDSMIRMAGNPAHVSWHYTLRSRDGQIAQHVRTRDIAWHAGNWYVNSRSIGLEHEGYLAKGAAWYTEAMYRASARLVRHLARKHDIPLDRTHIVGHDNVPGPTSREVPGMHEDPGPFWDWAHYFDLLGSPIEGSGGDRANAVVIKPDFRTHRPRFTGCTRAGETCPPYGASSVWLRTAPRPDAPLVRDIGKHGDGGSSHSVYDHAARASTGQRFALAGREGDWSAIWYLGQKAWFHNPPNAPTALPVANRLVTPRRGAIAVYGRAYPSAKAYPTRRSRQRQAPLQYRLPGGQYYTLGTTVRGAYHRSAFVPPARSVVRGGPRYHQIQFGHRFVFVKAKDVRVVRPRDVRNDR